MVANIELVIWSFLASLRFALLFRIVGRDLLWAAAGGALTRAAFLLFMEMTDKRLVYTMLAAMCAAFFAEYVGARKKMPPTVFLYPSIIPLIPADLLYNMMVGVVLTDPERITLNAQNLVPGLLGLCIGFVLASTISYYVRRKIFVRNNGKDSDIERNY